MPSEQILLHPHLRPAVAHRAQGHQRSLLGIGTAWVLNRLELWLYGLLYPGWELSLDVFSYFAP